MRGVIKPFWAAGRCHHSAANALSLCQAVGADAGGGPNPIDGDFPMFRRFGLYAGSTLAVLVLGGGLSAQDENGVSGALIEKALGQLTTKVARVNDGYVFKLAKQPITLNPVQGGNKVLLQARVTGVEASLPLLTRFNDEIGISTRAVRYSKDSVTLEAGLDCRQGITEFQLRRFIVGFGKDVKDFEAFIARGGKTPGKAAVEGVVDANPDDKPVVDPLPTGNNPAVSVKDASIPLLTTPGSGDREVEMHFPTQATPGEPTETAWKIVWAMTSRNDANAEGFNFPKGSGRILFRIKKAYYRPGPKADWLQVLEDVHPSEFYVPYFFHNTRFFDLRDVGEYVPLKPREGGAHSRLLGEDKRVMAELRDRGIVYKHGDVSRRGEELVLWANFGAGNYTYLVEYCFHDDGTVVLKHAPTGYNYFSHFESGSHMHNCLWRIGLKLAPARVSGKANNQVSLLSLPYDPKKLGGEGKLEVKPVATESFHDWNAKEFTRLRVTNPDVSNLPVDADEGERRPISYDVVPVAQGQARHYRFPDEAFSLHDFWVTRPDCPEKMYVNLPQHFAKQTAPVPLKGADGVVVWHMSSALHVPRSEDGIVKGSSSNNGQALVYWTVVELRPRNLFLTTPLYRK
jgi:primary-amine oxidase